MPGLYAQESTPPDSHYCLEDTNGFLIVESTFPNTSDVRFGVEYGNLNDPGIGTLILPGECDVLPGVAYGAPVCDNA